MIKFAGTNERGEPVVGFGLSRRNCERLLAGEPIRIPLDEMVPGLTANVLLFAGETEQQMHDQLKAGGAIRTETRVSKMHPDDPHGR